MSKLLTDLDSLDGHLRRMTARHRLVKAIRKYDQEAMVWGCYPEHGGNALAQFAWGLGFQCLFGEYDGPQDFWIVKSKLSAASLKTIHTKAEKEFGNMH